jgi:hypothetical protein
VENVFKHNKKIMVSKGGLNAIRFVWYFMFVQNNTPSLHHMNISPNKINNPIGCLQLD